MSHGEVLIISLHADPSVPSGVGEGGGTHAYLREITAGLAMLGRTCRLVTRRISPALEDRVSISPLATLFRIDIGPPGQLDKKYLNDFFEPTLAIIRNIIKGTERKPSVIHSVYWNSGRVALELSHETGIPFVHTVISNGTGRRLRGARGQESIREVIERKIFHGAHRIFSISASEKEDLVNLYSVPEEKIVVIGRPVDPCYQHAAHDETGRPGLFLTDNQALLSGAP